MKIDTKEELRKFPMSTVEIRPTILEVPQEKIKASLKEVANLVTSLHIDVEDGIFVPRKNNFTPQFVKEVKREFGFFCDIHLMVQSPLDIMQDYIRAGGDLITFHFESSNRVPEVVETIKKLGGKACLALKLETEVYLSKPYFVDLEEVLLMSVNPGFGGQEFDTRVLGRIKNLRELGYQGKIKVDGGVGSTVAKKAVEAGANILVVGTALFENGKIEVNYKKLIDSV